VSWYSVLPPPFDIDQQVHVVMVPDGSTGLVKGTPDGEFELGLIVSPRGTERVLQVLLPEYNMWYEHEIIAEGFGLDVLQPDYVGPLSGIPDEMLNAPRKFPLILRKGAMHEPPLNLRNYLRTTENNGN
jgi:hypothetical protein